MIKNYFKIAIRNVLKNKLFSFINIAGLGLAIPFALLSLMQVQSVYESDNFHPYPERTYRIITDVTSPGGSKTKYASSPYVLSDELKNDYPFVEKSTRIIRDFGWELTSRIKTIQVNSIFVEPSFFELFGFGLEQGTLPSSPNTLVLTHEMAEIFFGKINPVGKTLSHPDFGAFTVTGVLKPFKRNTHFRTDVMVSMATFALFNKNKPSLSSWYEQNTHTYALLREDTEPEALEGAMASIAVAANGKQLPSGPRLHFRKQNLRDISPDHEELENNPYVDSIRDLSLNFALALVIVLLAGFNYTNLTLARSLSRAKEVGVRKVTGALRYQLIGQFICEAIVIALLALSVGYLVLHIMRQFIHVNWITWEVDNPFILWISFVVFALFVGLLAGIMPAWILSGFKPVNVLKGTINPSSFGNINFRKSLVVVQFVVTSCFIFLIAHMYSQFKYMATDNENFNRKNIFNIALSGNEYRLLVNDISRHKDVEKLGLASTPFGGVSAQCGIRSDKTGNSFPAYYYAANADFVNNMQLDFAAGKNLPESNSDSATRFVVVNEQALVTLGLGLPSQAIGKILYLNGEQETTICGVVRNFCYSNYQFSVQPLVLQYNPSQFHIISVKTADNISTGQFANDMKQAWKAHHPYEELAYSWYEQEMYERYYPGADMKFLGLISLIVFVIAIMGLLGMVTYNTEKRVKEIGIRKVMGATVMAIVKELSRSYVKLVIIAACIAMPIGYVSGYFFLKLFTFNNGVNIGLMGFLFFIVFSIALSAIAVKAIQAAIANPAKSLRTE
jgi:putative ABC transport system permease protein